MKKQLNIKFIIKNTVKHVTTNLIIGVDHKNH